jgi:hypothetical protein
VSQLPGLCNKTANCTNRRQIHRLCKTLWLMCKRLGQGFRGYQ